MTQKELLTEENYERANKKIKTIARLILIIGLVIGVGLIAFGFIKKASTEKTNQELYEAAYAESEANAAAGEKRLSEIAQELSILNGKYNTKDNECNSLSMNDSDWFAKVNACHNEASAIRKEITAIEQEQFALKHADYTVYYTPIKSIAYVPFFVIGGMVIFVACGFSFVVWLITKRRAIAAYTVQSARPLVEEGVDKAMPTVKKVTKGIAEARAEAMNTVAPSLGKTAEEVSKGIARGIKEGKE